MKLGKILVLILLISAGIACAKQKPSYIVPEFVSVPEQQDYKSDVYYRLWIEAEQALEECEADVRSCVTSCDDYIF